MTAKQMALTLVGSGLADDVADAAAMLLDMGEISQAQADRLTAQAARQKKVEVREKVDPEGGTT